MEENLPAAQSCELSPAMMMMEAIRGGLDLEKVEKAMSLQIKWEENQAKKAYHEAMAAFKASPPKIDKDKHVKFSTSKGITEYDHASLANVTEKINSALSEHGLSAAWKMEQAETRLITVTCFITHKQGHSESTSLWGMPDESGGKNAIQSIGSTVTYLQRYTLLALTGLATHDMDDDGNGNEGPQYITDEQVKEIESLIAETKTDLIKFLAYGGVASVDKILAVDYKAAIASLNAKKKKLNGGN